MRVLLLDLDTLRPDHLGCYGHGRPTSPHIDALATEGVLFEQAVSSTSWTLPAHAAMFTGLADSVHGCTDTDRSLVSGHTTLAERLAVIDPTGKWTWADQAGGTGEDSSEGVAICAPKNMCVVGIFSGTATFDGTKVTSKGKKDAFVWKTSVPQGP